MKKQKYWCLHLRLILGSVFFILSCGHESVITKNRRSSANAVATPAIALTVESRLRDAVRTNTVKHALKTNLTIRNSSNQTLTDALSRFVTTIKVTGPSGNQVPVLNSELKPVPNSEQIGATASWEILLADSNGSADGEYSITITAIPPVALKLDGVDLPAPWTAKVALDSTQPMIATKSVVNRRLADGMRLLSAYAWVTNKNEANCKVGELRSSDVTKVLPVELQLTKDEELLKKFNLGASTPLALIADVAIPKDFVDPFTLYVKCTDAAGNSAEYIQPVGVNLPQFAFTAKALATDATVPGSVPGNDRSVSFVKPGVIKVALSLVDATSGQALTQDFVTSIASTMRVTFTEKTPTTIEELNTSKQVLWSQPYADTISLTLPSSYEGEKTIYASLISIDVTKNHQQLVGTVPIRLFAATIPSNISWMTGAQFIPFAANAPLSGKFQITSSQAPLTAIAPISLEYTTNNETWLPLPAKVALESAVSGSSSKIYTYNFNYPLATEQPFRIRVKATDIAGHVGVSGISASLIGRPTLALSVAQAERDACAASGTPKSKFKPWFASAVLCQFADVLGQRSGLYHAQILLQNRGGAPVEFYSTSSIAPGMGYRVLVDGVQVAQNRLLGNIVNGTPQPPSAFALAANASSSLFSFAVQSAWLQGSKVAIQFDREDTGVNSIANSCYAQGVDFPEVVIQDKAAGLTPLSGALPCDGN
ncbi:MAG: hypothetical protein FJ146_17605 [Deltaproteobacteria bacterium]|nr:hypothetical protein [Deltaproteobacteria bacterium]